MKCIAIDGPASSGKSATGKNIAIQLGFNFIDTGLMYRAITFIIIDKQIDYKNQKALQDFLDNIEINYVDSKIFYNNREIKPTYFFIQEVVSKVSEIAAISAIRKKLVAIQQKLAMNQNVVMVGRDITTVVMPSAELKIFLNATAEERARRRMNQSNKNMSEKEFLQLVNAIKIRDEKDSSRIDSPLKVASDAIVVDNSTWNLQETVSYILKIWNKKKL